MKVPIEKDHNKWLAGQRKKIGGSDIPTLLGISGSTLYDLWAYKTGRSPGFDGNDLTYIGVHTEDLVSQNWMEQYGVKLFNDNFVRFSDERPYLGVNLDRRIARHEKFGFRKGINQIKTTSDNTFNLALEKFPKEELGIRINHDKLNNTPFKYLVQLLVEGYCYGAEFGFLSCLILGDFTRKFHHAVFDFNDHKETLEDILALSDDFWYNHVEADVAPKFETLEDLAAEYSYSVPDSESVDQEVMDKLKRMEELKPTAKEFDNLKKEIKMDIQTVLKNNEKALSPEGKLVAAWKEGTSQKFNEGKFKKDNPLLHAQYVESKTMRRFNFK